MDSEDTVSTRDDLTGDWLWDFEDRYDLGAPDEPAATGAGPAAGGDRRVAEVKKHVRRRDGANVSPEVAVAVAAAATAAIEERQDDTRPVPFLSRSATPTWAASSAGTAAADPAVVGGDPALFGGEAAPRHFAKPQGGGRSHRGTIGAAVGVVVVLGVIGFISRSGGSHKASPSVALSTPSTASTVLSGPFGVVTTQPATSDTTAAPVPGTPTATTAPVTTGAPGGVTQTPAGTTNNAGNTGGTTDGNTGGTTGGTTRPTTRPTNSPPPPPPPPPSTAATTPSTTAAPPTPIPTNRPPPPATTVPTIVPAPGTTVPGTTVPHT